MKPLLRSIAIAASLLFTGAAIAEETKDKISWLFVQTAETAEVTSEDTLVMPVTRKIFAFTDRPNRLHDYVNGHEFALNWSEGGTFKADPPNAVLTWVDADKKVHEAEVILTGAEVRMQGRAIAYELEVEGDKSLALGPISRVSLFIDSMNSCHGCPPICLPGLPCCERPKVPAHPEDGEYSAPCG